MNQSPATAYWEKVASDARKASENNLRLASERATEIERLNLLLKVQTGKLDRITVLANEGRRMNFTMHGEYLEKIAALLGLARYVKPEKEKTWAEWAARTNYQEVGSDPLDQHTQVTP